MAALTAFLALGLVPGAALAQKPQKPQRPRFDTKPPQTTFSAAPDRATLQGAARFQMSSSEPRVSFECLLDGAPFVPFERCRQLVRLDRLAPGKHVFQVRAVDRAGNVDPTPARYVWEILRPEPPVPFKLSAGNVSRWAPVLKRATVRRRPRLGAAPIARLALVTPERTRNLVLVLERMEDERGRLWVRVRLPVLPNNQTGWVLRGALGGYTAVPTRLVVDRRRLTVTLFRYGKAIFRSRIGVGLAKWPTPRGEFYIRVKLQGFDDPFYGPLAFGTSARSAVLTDWPGGGYIGIHGTSLPELLPGRVSHGCIRMRNEDIVRLSRMLPVGTPLTIL